MILRSEGLKLQRAKKTKTTIALMITGIAIHLGPGFKKLKLN